MFGYVQLSTDKLRPVDYDEYKHLYCGLCHQIAHYSAFSRMFLSFDMTFFLILSAYDKRELSGQTTIRKCLKQIPCPDEIMDYWACLSVLLTYHKILDDQIDGKKIAKLSLQILKEAWEKACKQYPESEKKIAETLEFIQKQENMHSPNEDQLVSCFGQLVSDLVQNSPVKPDRQPELTQLLSRIACLLGEWIYYIDFYDDLDSDLVKKQYNPIIIQAEKRKVSVTVIQKEFRKKTDERVEELQRLCGFLPYSGYQEIVKNVIHEGIIHVTGNIYAGLTASGKTKRNSQFQATSEGKHL